MAIDIVDFPMKNGGSFHCYMLNYQRVHYGNWSPVPFWASCGNAISGALPSQVAQADDFGDSDFAGYQAPRADN